MEKTVVIAQRHRDLGALLILVAEIRGQTHPGRRGFLST